MLTRQFIKAGLVTTIMVVVGLVVNACSQDATTAVTVDFTRLVVQPRTAQIAPQALAPALPLHPDGWARPAAEVLLSH